MTATRRQHRRDAVTATVRARPVATATPASVATALAAPGEPLEFTLRTEMERRLGHDFGDVRVHADTRAATAARTLDADAFTSGHDIVFAAGRYRPDTPDGRWLIAHELVHTIQQGGRRHTAVPQTAGIVSRAPVVPEGDPLEREAAEAATRVVHGETAPPGAISIAAAAASGRLARATTGSLDLLPAEVPDPPEAVDAVTADIARTLLLDRGDDLGRVKRRLARLAPGTRAAVVAELGGRVPEAAATRLREILAELRPPGAGPLDAATSAATETSESTTTATEATAQKDETTGDVSDRTAPAPDAANEEQGGAVDEQAETGRPEAGQAETGQAETGQPDADGEPAADAVLQGPVAEPVLDGAAAEEAGAVPSTAVAAEERTDPSDAAGSAAGPGSAGSAASGGSAESAEPDAATGGPAARDAAVEDGATGEPVDAPAAGAARAAEPAPPPDAGAPVTEEDGADGPTAEADDRTEGGDAEPGAPVSDLDDEVAATPDEQPEPADEEVVLEQPADGPGSADITGEPSAAVEPADEGTADAGEAGGPSVDLTEDVPDGGPAASADATLVEPEGVEADRATDRLEADGAGAEGAAAEAEPAAADDAGGAATEIEEPTEPAAPDLSEAEPSAAMEAAGALPPARSAAALGAVDAAASRSVGARRTALAEQPPTLDKPTGAPTAAELAAETGDVDAPSAPERLVRAPAPPAAGPTPVSPLPPVPVPVTGAAPAPRIPGGTQGELTEDGRRALQASLRALPVHDPALDISAGPAPVVALDGAADPRHAHDERAKLETAARGALTDGRRAILRPAGEERLVPDVPAERLTAVVTPATPATPAPAPTAGASAAGAAMGGAAMAGADPASIIARQQRGDELRAAGGAAATAIRTRDAEHAASAAEERRRSQADVTTLVRESAALQAERRVDGRRQVHAQRESWSAAEHALADGKLTEADTRVATDVQRVADLKAKGDVEVAGHIEHGEADASAARREAEEQAIAERTRGEERSGGVLGWLADQATALFDEIKAGIAKVFQAARAAVRKAIEQAKRLAAAAIDFYRDAIVTAIRRAGDALIAIGDTMLAGFPGVRDRFRRAVEERVASAQAAINDLADGLKRAVQKALDVLGGALDAALGLLERGMLLAVEAYRAVVSGALRFADGVVKAFGAFAVLVAHIAANPGQWLTNLAASAKDGVRNHLWKAFQSAVAKWFWEKVEEVLGLGLTIWNLIKRGGLSVARVGTMAWEAIKSAIPPALVQILIEKLISLLIPAAAAVMLIIEGLQAAWSSVRRVLAAFERFFAFLKAVRTGRAGPQFAAAVAAGAVAVIDFVANWLLRRLRKAAGKLAKKLRAFAGKLGAKLAKRVKGLLPQRRKRPTSKRKPDKRARAEQRVTAATDFIGRQLDRGMWEPVLWAQIQYARARWRVRASLRTGEETGTLTISVNPKKQTKIKRGTRKSDYRQRILDYQGFLNEHHHRHHILTRALSPWWNAVGLDWNDPQRFLEVPAMLHLRGLHASYKKIRAKPARSLTAAWNKKLHDLWNVLWLTWLVGRLPSWGISPRTLDGYRAAVKSNRTLRDKVAGDIDDVGTPHVMRKAGGLVGVPQLSRFHIRKKGSAAAQQKRQSHLKRLAKLASKLAAARSDAKRKAILAKWQGSLVGGSKRAKVLWRKSR